MAFIKRGSLGLWALGGGKYAEASLEEVARIDPSYLNWVWNEKKIYDFLPDDAAYALEDTMKKYGIPFDKRRR